MCEAYGYLPYTIFRFYLMDFQNSQLCVFVTINLPSVTQRRKPQNYLALLREENALEQNPVGFSSQNYVLKSFFYSN